MGVLQETIVEQTIGNAKESSYKSQCNASTDPLFSPLNIIKLNDLYNFDLGKYMYEQTNQLLPTPLLQKYGRIADLHI